MRLYQRKKKKYVKGGEGWRRSRENAGEVSRGGGSVYLGDGTRPPKLDLLGAKRRGKGKKAALWKLLSC